MTPDAEQVAPPLGEHAESTHVRALSMALLEVDPSLVRAVETPIELRLGPAKIRLEGGYVTPILSGRYSSEWEREGARLLQEARERGEQLRVPTAEERGDREVVGVVWSAGTGSVDVVLQDAPTRCGSRTGWWGASERTGGSGSSWRTGRRPSARWSTRPS